MQRTVSVLAISAWMLAGHIGYGQSTASNPTVLVREVHFVGESGGTQRELRECTEFLVGHRMEKNAVLKESTSAVAAFLHRRGFLKARVSPEIRPARTFGSAKEEAVALEITIEAGNRYRIKDLTFAGLSRQVDDAELRRTCNLRNGEVADGGEAGNCVSNLIALFHQKGLDVTVIPSMTFDEERSTVVFGFDIEK